MISIQLEELIFDYEPLIEESPDLT